MTAITRLIVLFVLFAFAKAYQANAQQDFTGIATYQSKMTLKMEKDSVDDAEMTKRNPVVQAALEAALKTAGQATFTLQFSKDESMYEKVKELAKPKPSSGMTITISGGGGEYGKTYKNLKEGTFVREDNIMGKPFLVVDDLENHEWEITGETKMIGQYQAIKAVLKEKKEKAPDEDEKEEGTSILKLASGTPEETTAWFTPMIPVSNGPGTYQGLPGLILELNAGPTTLLCTKIELNPDLVQIKKPKKGKEIGLEEFRELRDKKRKEALERFKRKKGAVIIGG
jgi:GLPGLI family protein